MRPFFVYTFLILLAVAAVQRGLQLRHWLWDATAPTRFTGDIGNGWDWGQRVLRDARFIAIRGGRGMGLPTWSDVSAAYVNFYDKLVRRRGKEGDFGLDYTPLRLAIISAWVRYEAGIHPRLSGYQDLYAAPLLHFNTACELAAAAAAFALVYAHVRRRNTGRYTPALLGMTAALLLWFNLAVLVDAHAWPQWDVWLVPFFLWAVVLAHAGRWMEAGALLAVGAMLKGQILLGAPVLALWPLFRGQWGAVVRIGVGFAAALAVMTLPWMVPHAGAGWWLAGVGYAVVVVFFAARMRSQRAASVSERGERSSQAKQPAAPAPLAYARGSLAAFFIRNATVLVLMSCALAAILWPWIGNRRGGGWGLLCATLVMLFYWLPRRHVAVCAVAALSIGVFAASQRFNGSLAWYQVGFDYPQRHYRVLNIGTSSNLPAILANQYRWKLTSVAYTLPARALWAWPRQDWPIPLRGLLIGVYVGTLILCGIAAARSNPQCGPPLAALVAPWVLAFALLPQMHERYLLWGAAVSALYAGMSIGAILLHLAITFCSAVMITHGLLNVKPAFAPALHRFVAGTHPGLGWAVLFCASAALYLALRSTRKANPPALS